MASYWYSQFFKREGILPTIDTWLPSSEVLKDYVYQQHFSNFFPVGQFIYFMLSLVLGVSYVNYVTLNNTRGNVFFSLREEYSVYNPYIDAYPFKYSKCLDRENWNLYAKYLDFKSVLFVGMFVFL